MTFCFKNVNGGREYTSEVKCLPHARFDHQDKQELEDKDVEEERRGRVIPPLVLEIQPPLTCSSDIKMTTI